MSFKGNGDSQSEKHRPPMLAKTSANSSPSGSTRRLQINAAVMKTSSKRFLLDRGSSKFKLGSSRQLAVLNGIHNEEQSSARSAESEGKGKIGDAAFNDYRIFVWDNGDEYKGFWKENQMHGKGRFKCNEGVYQGEFVSHSMHGFGRFDFSKGGTYMGQYKHGKREGEGLLAYTPTNVYEGEFIDGLPNGNGTIVYENGNLYAGSWVKGEPDGEGLAIVRNRTEYYRGTFKTGSRDGHGDLWLADQDGSYTKWTADYEDGKLKRRRPRPPCTLPELPVTPLKAWNKKRHMDIDTSATSKQNFEDFVDPGSPLQTDAGYPVLAGIHSPDLLLPFNEEEDEVEIDEILPAYLRAAQSTEKVVNHDGHRLQNENQKKENLSEQQNQSVVSRLFGSWCGIGRKNVFQPQHGRSRGSTMNTLQIALEHAKHLPDVLQDRSKGYRVVVEAFGGDKCESRFAKNGNSPTWREILELEISEEDTDNILNVRVEHVNASGRVSVLGICSIEFRDLTLNESTDSISLSLLKPDGASELYEDKEQLFRSELRLSYRLLLPHDAILSVNIFSGRHLLSHDARLRGSPFVRVWYCGKHVDTKALSYTEHPHWEEMVNFQVLSDEAFRRLGYKARQQRLPAQKLYIEVWEKILFREDFLIGLCEVDASGLIFNKKNGQTWAKLFHPTRKVPEVKTRFGSLRYCVAWGSSDLTALRVHIEEGFNLTSHVGLVDANRNPLWLLQSQNPQAKKDPDPYLKITFMSKLHTTQKTKVMRGTLNPVWDEKLVFSCRQVELPDMIRVECFDKHHLLADEFMGEVYIDLTNLVLEGNSFVRWYRLEDPELLAVAKKKKLLQEKRLKQAELLRRGIFLSDDDSDLEEEDNKEETHFSIDWFGNHKSKRIAELMKQLDAGKDPEELGRLKIRLQWIPVEDESDRQCQRMWEQRLADPTKRKVIEKVMQRWVNNLQAKAFSQLKRFAVISAQQAQVAAYRHLDLFKPRIFNLWVHVQQIHRVQKNATKRWNLANRLRPSFDDLGLNVRKAKERKKAAMGSSAKFEIQEDDHASSDAF